MPPEDASAAISENQHRLKPAQLEQDLHTGSNESVVPERQESSIRPRVGEFFKVVYREYCPLYHVSMAKSLYGFLLLTIDSFTETAKAVRLSISSSSVLVQSWNHPFLLPLECHSTGENTPDLDINF